VSANANKVMSPAEWLLLLALSVLWGGPFFFYKVLLSAPLPPLTIVFGRVGIAALALNALVRLSGYAMPPSPRRWGAFLAMGALNNLIPFTLIVWAETQITGGLASILNATTPLFTVALAHVLTADERITANRAGGILLGVAGVAVMIGPEAFSGLGLHVLAQFGVLVAAVSYACAGIFGRRFKGTPPLVTAAGQVTGTALMTLPIVLIVDRPWALPVPTPGTWATLVAFAVLSTALAYVIYFRLLASAGATNLLLVTILMPVSSLLLGTTVLGERLDARDVIGMALIGIGLAAIDGRALAFLVGFWERRRAGRVLAGRDTR